MAAKDRSGRAGEASNDNAAEARGGGVGRLLLLLVVGSVLALALSATLRTKVLDLLFGAEEEFDYSPTTAPETPAPAGVAGS